MRRCGHCAHTRVYRLSDGRIMFWACMAFEEQLREPFGGAWNAVRHRLAGLPTASRDSGAMPKTGCIRSARCRLYLSDNAGYYAKKYPQRTAGILSKSPDYLHSLRGCPAGPEST